MWAGLGTAQRCVVRRAMDKAGDHDGARKLLIVVFDANPAAWLDPARLQMHMEELEAAKKLLEKVKETEKGLAKAKKVNPALAAAPHAAVAPPGNVLFVPLELCVARQREWCRREA